MKTLMVVSKRGPRAVAVCLAALLTLPGSLPASAQQPAPAAATPRPQYERVVVTAGRSTVVPTDFDVTRIAITNPEIADAVVVQPREILVDGKKAGTVSLIVWGADTRRQYDIVVEPAITALEQHLQALFPGEAIAVSVSEEAIILSGLVSSTTVMLRAAEIAASSSAKSKVINMLQVPGGSESQQVMLQVRFAEVNRKALTELGINLFVNRERFAARSTTQQFASPIFDDEKPGGMVFSDFLNLFFFDRKEGIGGVIKALESKGGFQSLAEPNLIAYNGQEASFLAGGEFPVPIAQGGNVQRRVGHLQGVRHPAELQADDCRRRDSTESPAGGQRARLRQRRHARGLPDPGADDAARGNGCRAARRAIVRDRRPARQRQPGRRVRDSDPEQAADHRGAVQEQGGAPRGDGIDGAHHPAARAAAEPRRSAGAPHEHPAPDQAGRRPRAAARRPRRHRRRAGRQEERACFREAVIGAAPTGRNEGLTWLFL